MDRTCKNKTSRAATTHRHTSTDTDTHTCDKHNQKKKKKHRHRHLSCSHVRWCHCATGVEPGTEPGTNSVQIHGGGHDGAQGGQLHLHRVPGLVECRLGRLALHQDAQHSTRGTQSRRHGACPPQQNKRMVRLGALHIHMRDPHRPPPTHRHTHTSTTATARSLNRSPIPCDAPPQRHAPSHGRSAGSMGAPSSSSSSFC